MTDKPKKKDTTNAERQARFVVKRKKIEAQWAVILEAIKELERLKG
jgi:hypothetical protein